MSWVLAQAPDEEELPDFEPLVEERVEVDVVEARPEVGLQLGISAPRSELQAGAAPTLTVGWSPAAVGGRLRAGVLLGVATGATSGSVEGHPWEARQTELACHAQLALRALSRPAPVSPELLLSAGPERTWALVESQGGSLVEPDLRLGWLAGPALTASLPVGSLSIQLLVAGGTSAPLGADSALAFRPSIGWRWHP